MAALWRTNDWEDALYAFGAGLAVAMSSNLQLEVELLNNFRTGRRSRRSRNNDVAFLTAIVFKN